MKTILALTLALALNVAPARAELAPTQADEGVGRGVATGYGSGLHGSEFTQDLHVRVPVWRMAGTELRVLVLHDGYRGPHRLDVGGRLGVFAFTGTQAELVRGYVSGGVHVIGATTGVEERRPTFGGGVELGVELFALLKKLSFYAEVGGASGDRLGFGDGLTAMAGVRAYPF